MHRSEEREAFRCAACGTEVGTRDQSYAFAEEGMLCSDCAIARGGRYDAEEDCWVRQPETADLLR